MRVERVWRCSKKPDADAHQPQGHTTFRLFGCGFFSLSAIWETSIPSFSYLHRISPTSLVQVFRFIYIVFKKKVYFL